MKIWARLFLLIILTTSCKQNKENDKHKSLSKQDSMIINYEMKEYDSLELDFYTTKDDFTFMENK